MTTGDRARRTELLRLLTAGDPGTPLVERVCEIGTRVLGVSGAGMCLVGGSGPQVFVHGTDPLIEELEGLQVILGQGPGIRAIRTGLAVVVPDLAERCTSWQGYADRALARGVRALFTFPLSSDRVQLGALDLYRMQAGPLGRTETADALVLAEIATRSILQRRNREDADGTVSARHWLTAGRRYLAGRSPGRASDVGVTVEQVLAGHGMESTPH